MRVSFLNYISRENKKPSLAQSQPEWAQRLNIDFHVVSKCPICGSDSFTLQSTNKTMDATADFRLDIRSCNKCYHWHTNPNPSVELLAHLYATASPAVIGANWDLKVKSQNVKGTLASDDHWIVSRLLSQTAGNFLEVGSGDGSLVRKMRSLGWNSWGVDLGSYAAGYQIVTGVSQITLDKKFDVIVFQDVLEHVSNPIEEMSVYTPYLSNDCLLFVTVPWSESKRAKVLGGDWDMVKPLGHLHYFSKISAKVTLQKNKFDAIEMFPVNIYGFQARSVTFAFLSLLAGLLRQSRWRELRQRLKQLRSLVAIYPEKPLGDQLYVVGKKTTVEEHLPIV